MASAVRICLLGRLAVEVDGIAVDDARLGGLGRTALAYLAIERRRPVPRDELADVLWGEDLPATWESALRGVVSRVRTTLSGAGVIRSEFGCYQLQLPEGVVIDFEEAVSAVERAEREGPDEARTAAQGAVEILARGFLPGAPGTWVERRQAEVDALRVRALEALAGAASACGDHAAAIAAAEEAVALAPLQEPAHQRLMTALAGAGNRAAALRAYTRCRERLADELGVDPSPETERLYVELLADEPAPVAVATNLPARRTSFVGREDQVAQLLVLLASTRLLTLTGPGGVGKSRLALRVAEELLDSYGDGAWLVELASLSDPSLVGPAVLSVLGVPEAAGDPAGALARHLGHRHLLLVLDNCEHVIAASAALADSLLRACPRLHIVATSREPVGVPGETTWAVPGLSPAASVQLFCDRARAAVPDLDITASIPDIERICAQLEGIPLAIELAAARTRAFSVAEIAGRLDDRLRLLVGGPRAAPDRHQTLRAAVDWSFAALPGAEQSLFARLSVFAGGFTLAAAEAVGGEPDSEILDGLSALVDKSLVTTDRVRYRMLETLRQYAGEQLDAAGERITARDRHLAWALALAEAAESRLEGGEQARWLAVLDDEHDNVRAALDHAATLDHLEEGLRLAASLVRFWEIRGFFGEGRARLEALAGREAAPPALRAKALNAAAVLAQRQGDYSSARALYEESLVIRRALGDRLGAATALHGLANLAVAHKDLETARTLFEENLAIARELGLERMTAASLMNLGVVAQYSFMYRDRPTDEAGPEAAAYYQEARECYRRMGDRFGEALALENLGALWRFYPGDIEGSRARHEESLAIRRELGDKQGIAASARYVAFLALRSGEVGAARDLHRERMAIERELGNTPQVAEASVDLAEIALGQGELDEARRLLAESRAAVEALDNEWWNAFSLSLEGELARRESDFARARDCINRSRAISQETGDRHGEARGLVFLARVARSEGRREEARALVREAIPRDEGIDMGSLEAAALDVLVGLAADREDARAAARLAGAAQAARTLSPYGPDQEREADLAAARDALGDEAFSAAWEEGLAMTRG
ncbi:MAG: tetratricopeptide repeat protein, partial [Acidimicrobiales bacterium]